jgi:hypothetical protein
VRRLDFRRHIGIPFTSAGSSCDLCADTPLPVRLSALGFIPSIRTRCALGQRTQHVRAARRSAREAGLVDQI